MSTIWPSDLGGSPHPLDIPLMRMVSTDFAVDRGAPLPLGSSLVRGGVNIAVFSRHASVMMLVLFEPGGLDPVLELPLDPRFHRTGDVWHASIRGLEPGFEYGFRVDGPQTAHHRFDFSRVLLDPHARAVAGRSTWGATPLVSPRAVVVDHEFDWGFDQPLNRPLSETIIYELHVRGFTRDASSGVAHPGTFAGLIEKIPYLQALGVTAVELLPITEFDETDVPCPRHPETGERLVNFWGYHPIAYYAPKASYAADRRPGGQVYEFKRLVHALHAAGIEVILDLVFNHTGEGGVAGPTTSFRGLDNAIYYLTDAASGAYLDYSGCGNSMNCNHPVVRDLILDCLRYWVMEMHVDGFRFDLASVLGRGRDGAVLTNPPLIEGIAADPILAGTKLIAEAWDAAGLYQVGSFPSWGRWAEWNGRYRDDVRRFLKGDAGLAGAIATRIAGSPDLYRSEGRHAHHSINFITSHDGFTLRDLVSYDGKHNHGNGEDGRDGCNENDSWNCGWEGSPAPDAIEALRARQVRNALVLLLMSRGVPMLLAGDECGRTQRGNNNAYCQDSPVSWLDWSAQDQELQAFLAGVILFRRTHPQLCGNDFLDSRADGSASVIWHGRAPLQPDWSHESRLVVFSMPETDGDTPSRELYVAMNMHADAVTLHLPAPGIGGTGWRRVLDTSLPDDVANGGFGMRMPPDYTLAARSCLVLEAWYLAGE
jgi:glycogen operon protein